MVDLFGDLDENEIAQLEADEDILETVWAHLKNARPDPVKKAIRMANGQCYTITQLAKQIAKTTSIDWKRVNAEIIGWLEMGYSPDDLSEHELELFERQIDKWVNS